MKQLTLRDLMRVLFIFVALAVYVGCEKAADGPPNGLLVESKEGRFSIVLPDSFPQPEVSAKPVTTEIGEITMHLYTSSKSDGSAFIMSYNDYPDSAFAKEPTQMMDDIRDGALGNMNARLEHQKDFTFEGHPARTLDFSLSTEGSQGFGRLQYMIVKPRLYQVIFLALGNKAERDAETIQQSFASFKLLE